MSGTQGRFPPAMPAAQPHGQQPQPQPAWPPMQQMAAPAQPAFPPRLGHPSAPVGYPDPNPPTQANWTPAPPAPFPPPGQPQHQQAPPQQQHAQQMQRPVAPQHPSVPQQQSYYPPQAPAEQIRTEPPRRAPDPTAYDLGSYGLPTQPPQNVRPVGPPPQAPQPQQQWAQQQPQHNPYAIQAQQPQAQQPAGYTGGGYGYQPQPNGQLGHYQQQPEQQVGAEQAEYQDEVEFDEPPRKSRRWLIGVALVASIGIGSGMAYGYKMFIGPKGDKDQVVRAPSGPSKIAATERGGKQTPNQDSRVLNGNRVPSDGNATAGGGDVSSGYTNSNGVRVVQTIPQGPAAVPNGPSTVPGMTIVGPSTGPGANIPQQTFVPPTQQPPQSQRVAVAPPQQPAPPRTPVVKNLLPDVAAEPAPPKQTRVVAAEKATAAPAADRPKAVGGFVAVLGFQKSQMEAMKMMAELEQKYEPLRGKKLEIIQSDGPVQNLGVIYRVVVGPRGSNTAARGVCSELYQAGMPQNRCYALAP